MITAPYKLSLLDKSPVQDGADAHAALETSLAYAQKAEDAGYHRIWFAEHHGAPTLASTAPEVLAAFVLARTNRIRVGTGGVLLQHYSPFKVAEAFRLLSALAPGRVDLGIGKAPGGMPFGTRALQSELRGAKPREFEQKLVELDAFMKDGVPEEHPLHGARAFPDARIGPDRFLLGASPDSATLAARLGWGFCFAGHHNGDPEALRAAIAAYSRTTGRKPSLAVNAHVGSSEAAAEALVSRLSVFKVHFADGHAVNLPNEDAAREYARQYGLDDYRLEEKQPRVLAGTAGTVRAELDRLHRLFGITEFIIDSPVASADARLSSIELLSESYRSLAAAE